MIKAFLALTDVCCVFSAFLLNLWKVFIILRSRLSRLRTFCIRRHFTAVSSRLAGLMRWAVCLQTRISCLSSVRAGQTGQERGIACLVYVKQHGPAQSLQQRSSVAACSVIIVQDLVGGWLRGYKDVFGQHTVSPHRGTNAARRWAN